MDRQSAAERANELLERYSQGEMGLEEAAGSPLLPLLLSHLVAGQQARATEIARAIVAVGELLFDDEIRDWEDIVPSPPDDV